MHPGVSAARRSRGLRPMVLPPTQRWAALAGRPAVAAKSASSPGATWRPGETGPETETVGIMWGSSRIAGTHRHDHGVCAIMALLPASLMATSGICQPWKSMAGYKECMMERWPLRRQPVPTCLNWWGGCAGQRPCLPSNLHESLERLSSHMPHDGNGCHEGGHECHVKRQSLS